MRKTRNLYIFTAESFEQTNARIGIKPVMHETPLRESIDIDTPEDWEMGVIITTSFENRSNKGKKLEIEKILITCPPMLGLKEELIPIIQEAGFEPICPNVTQTMSEEDLSNLYQCAKAGL